MTRPKPADRVAIGRRILAAREAAGLSQRRACVGLSFSPAYLSRIEAGDRLPSVRALRELAPVLGVSLAWLETGRDVVELELDRTLLARLRFVLTDDGPLLRRKLDPPHRDAVLAAIDRTLAVVASPPSRPRARRAA